MGAHHRVYLTTKITLSIPKDEVKNNNLLSFLPKSCQNDFDCVHQEDYIQESPELTDGTKLKFENTFLVFALKKEYLENVHSFLIESLKTAKDVIYAENDNYRELLDEFISTFKKIDIDVETLYTFNEDKFNELSDELKDISCNYFTNYKDIPTYVVYEGIPNEFIINNGRYSFIGFDIVYSYFKLNESRDETILFAKLKEELERKVDYYPLNKYIYHLGY
ncbi:MAG: hypothetical protein HN398_08500 [Thiotrichales bacterium]|jgi:hypothetical protein|nr:hypothetical protein [Thiotrichales bacterium]